MIYLVILEVLLHFFRCFISGVLTHKWWVNYGLNSFKFVGMIFYNHSSLVSKIYNPFIKSVEFYLFCYKCLLNHLSAIKEFICHTIWISVHSTKLFEVGCLHQHTVTALYRLDRNEKLLEIFAYPSNNCAFYGPELNL